MRATVDVEVFQGTSRQSCFAKNFTLSESIKCFMWDNRIEFYLQALIITFLCDIHIDSIFQYFILCATLWET